MIALAPGILADLSTVLERFFGLFGIELEIARRQGLRLVAILIMAVIGWYLVRVVADRILKVADDGDEASLSIREKRAKTVSGLLTQVGRSVIITFVVILVLDTFMNITPLLAGAGIIGLAISFGSQSLVKDVISGFFILMERQFDVGDVVAIADKSGTVERMSLRMVVLRDLDGSIHVIPNGQISTVTNHTRGWSRAVVDLGVAYHTDVDEAIEILRDEAARFAADPLWKPRLDGIPEVVGVEGLGDSKVTLRVLLRTRPGKHWEVGREYRRRAIIRLDREGVKVPNPNRTVIVRHADVEGRITDDVRPPGGD